jgi:hypothetical protein
VCGFETCATGTSCCLKHNPPSLTCIPNDQPCDDQPPCAGDSDCQQGQHCCEIVSAQQVQCVDSCPGALSDGTVRICQSSAECPPDRPNCGQVQINSRTLPACVN